MSDATQPPTDAETGATYRRQSSPIGRFENEAPDGVASVGDDPDEPDPVTDRVHDTSWSANLEKPRHADRRDKVVGGAIRAIDHTARGQHVNLVTHSNHGHPADYLFDVLRETYDDEHVSWEFVEQCGCGGYVTRVAVE